MAAGINTLPFPIYGAAYRYVFPWLDADGDLVPGVAGADAEISKDCGAFADCTNEAVDIAAASGMHYLDFTYTEMTAGVVAIMSKGTGVKTTPIVFYPKRLPVIHAGNGQAVAEDSITLAVTATAKADFFNGCYVRMTAGTGTGQVRLITDYSAGRVASVWPNWETNPTGLVYEILVPENAIVSGWNGMQIADQDVDGVPKIDLGYIHGTALTETSGQLAGRFKDLFDRASGALPAVDGITYESLMEMLLAAVSGVTGISGNTISFKKRDGTTSKMTVTYGDEDGERTGTVIDN